VKPTFPFCTLVVRRMRQERVPLPLALDVVKTELRKRRRREIACGVVVGSFEGVRAVGEVVVEMVMLEGQI
jgi:hypothetical protein